MLGYLDPASGSAIVGVLAAGAAGAGVAARTMLAKLHFKRRGAGEAEMSGVDQPDE